MLAIANKFGGVDLTKVPAFGSNWSLTAAARRMYHMLQSFTRWLQTLFTPQEVMAGMLAILLGFVAMSFFRVCHHAIATNGWW